MKREWLWNGAAVLSTTCALIITGLALARFVKVTDAPVVGQASPLYIDTWKTMAEVGHTSGPIDAPLVLVVFADFECPFCGKFATSVLPHLQATYKDDLRIVYRHWTLSYHRFAYPAAMAAECAADQGKFFEFHDAVYRQQDSLGLKPFEQFAIGAGVADTSRWRECVRTAAGAGSISQDSAAAYRLGAFGTPAVLLNGFLFRGAPSVAELDSAIASFDLASVHTR